MNIDFFDPSTTPNAEYRVHFCCLPIVVDRHYTMPYMWRLIQYCDVNHIFYDLTYDELLNQWLLSIEHKPFSL